MILRKLEKFFFFFFFLEKKKKQKQKTKQNKCPSPSPPSFPQHRQSCHSCRQHVISPNSTFLPSIIKLLWRILELQSGNQIKFKHKKGDKSKSKKARVVIIVPNTSFRPALPFYQVSSNIPEGIHVTGRTQNQIIIRRGGNNKSQKAKVVILVYDTYSHPVLHFYQVS